MPKLACFHDTASFGAKNGLAADSRIAGVTARYALLPFHRRGQAEAVAIFNADLLKFFSIHSAIYLSGIADQEFSNFPIGRFALLGLTCVKVRETRLDKIRV
jgi:hypothetical protein